MRMANVKCGNGDPIVNPVDDPVVTVADEASMQEDAGVSIAVLENDVAVDSPAELPHYRHPTCQWWRIVGMTVLFGTPQCGF